MKIKGKKTNPNANDWLNPILLLVVMKSYKIVTINTEADNRKIAIKIGENNIMVMSI
jgi:hypothetical protein